MDRCPEPDAGPLAEWHKRGDMVVHEISPLNAEPSSTTLAEAPITDTDAFYVRNHGPIPRVDPSRWRLVIDGLVRDSLRLSLHDLRSRFPEHTLTVTLQCAGNRRAGLAAVRDIPGEDLWRDGAASTAWWTGVRLGDVLRAAGLGASAEDRTDLDVAIEAPDISPVADPPQPFGGSIPLSKALSGEVLLAWAMNGRPLLPIHGAPVRVLVPGWIGARSVKWVEHVTVRRGASQNYFQAVAYRLLPAETDPAQAGADAGVSLGPVALNSAILAPSDGAGVLTGQLEVRGYAVAGDGRTVVRVDVSSDGGATWTQADLGPDLGPWAWRQWHAVVVVAAGEQELVARAWDNAASCQPENPAHLWNPKGYANSSWPRVKVRATSGAG